MLESLDSTPVSASDGELSVILLHLIPSQFWSVSCSIAVYAETWKELFIPSFGAENIKS